MLKSHPTTNVYSCPIALGARLVVKSAVGDAALVDLTVLAHKFTQRATTLLTRRTARCLEMSPSKSMANRQN